MRKTVVLLTTLMSFAAIRPTTAQSFDCAKAKSPVEKLICKDTALGQLDLDLAKAVKRFIAIIPDQRKRMLLNEHRWIIERDQNCPVVETGTATKTVNCLTQSYQERIASINGDANAGPPDKALCQRVVDVYRSIVKANPTTAAVEGNSQFLASPNHVVFKSSNSGISTAKSVAAIPNPTEEKIAAWARSQPEPFDFPPDLLKKITAGNSGSITIDKVPDAHFYMAWSIGGTAYCYESNFFVVTDGHARSALPPPDWKYEIGNDCGIDRSFGKIDGAPVAIQQDENRFTANINPSLSIMPWKGDHFANACTIEFKFAPAFFVNNADDNCETSSCHKQQKVTLPLIQKIQAAGPENALKASFDDLTPQQKAAYHAIETEYPAETEQPDRLKNPDDLQDRQPLFLPLIDGEKVCRASIGHSTMGWRQSPNWTVIVACPEKGALSENEFTVSMGAGHFIEPEIQ